MKKVLSMVLAAMLLLSLCSFASAEDVVELEFVYHKTESNAIDAMETVINNFNAANPGIKVNFVQVPDTATVLQSRAQLNEMPDMFGCTTGNMFELMFEDGIIMDLTGQEFLSSVEPSSLEMSTYNGKNWRLPYSLSCYGLYVRTDIFEEQGLALPTTWDELMDVCEKLTAAGITPFALPDKTMVYQRMERMMSFMSEDDTEFKQIAAGELDAKDSKLLQNYANASLQIVNYMTPESLGAEYTESYQQLIAGQAAMTINGGWSLATLKDYDPDIKVALIPMPNPTGEESKVVVSIDTNFCISSSTKHPEECLKFFEYLAQPEVAQVYANKEGSPCVINGVTVSTPELSVISEAMAEGKICLSQNAIWPSGFRKALGNVATELEIDQDVDAFYEGAAEVIDEYYNN
ncbi:MAG: extracellular solute-binding protein [Candidatus Limiplasma sp.]|nr:extracellular solute-binding protein [Candidatus Limiplasma sp.]MDY4061429.1 extracellular solute-binding protein [Candidatus Limiplasma sp.]